MTWREYGYVVASKYRVKTVQVLTSHPKTPKEISNETHMALSHVSRTLRELTEKGLVICINPDEVKGRVYELTDSGKRIAQILETNRKFNQ